LAEARVELPVPVERGIDTDLIAGAELADTSLEKVFLDGPAHKVVLNRCLGDLFVERDGLVIVLAFQSDKVSCLEPELVCERLCVITLVPSSCFFVGCARAAVVAELNLIEFSKILLVGGCAAEVAFAAVMSDGLV
jgi:hypothetical protein